MFKRTQICTGVLLALSGTAWVTSAMAQTTQPSEVVEVTGSRIKRIDAENAAPITILKREDIEKTGATNASEVIRGLTGDSNGSIPSAFGTGFAAGASAVSLRGLGVNSTLVLLNGRRMAPYGLADDGQRNFTDLGSIPLDAIDRIEVLKEGASALYGADAVGGVINIILRNTFTGVSVNVSGGLTRYSDGKNARASVTGGFGDLATDKFNVFANLEVSRQSSIMQSQRYGRGPQFRQDMTEAGYDYLEFNQYGILIPGVAISGGPAGAVRDASGGTNYRFLPCPGGTVQPSAAAVAQYPGLLDNFSSQNGGPAGCTYNVFDYFQVQPKEDRLNLFVRGTVQLGGDWQGYAELSRFQTKVETKGTLSSVSSNWPDATTNTLVSNAGITIADTHPDNPFTPDGAANRLRYHTAEFGGRNGSYDTVASRGLFGAKGTVGAWDLDAAVMYSESVTDIERTGYLRNSVLRDYLSGTNVSGQNPGLEFYRLGVNAGLNSAAVRNAISPTLVNQTKTSVTLVDVRAGRELMKLAGGPLAMSVGAEWRKEELSSPATPFTTEADIVGLGFSEFFGSRSIYAVYGEVVAPLFKGFELNGALRHDRYSDVGSSTTPKVGFKWAPVNSFLVRGSYSGSFRAPGPAESGNSASAGFTNYVDPLLCPGGNPVTGATAADCSGTVIVSSIGNPAIKPETAKSYTLGLVFEPTPDTNLSVDYWKVDRKNEISAPDPQQILNNPTIIPNAQIIRQDDGRGLIGVGDPTVNGGAGAFAVAGVLAPYFNANATKTDGIDLDLRHRFNLGSAGRLSVGAAYTYILSFKRTFPDGSTLEYVGSHGPTALSGNGGMPKDRATLSLGWDVGPWSTTGRVNYIGGMSNKETADDVDCLNHFADGSDAPSGCKIPSFTTVDLGLKWSGIKNLDIYGGVKNVFDAKSPYDPQVYSAFHYNPIYHLAGAIGRSYSVGLRYTFK